MAQGLDQKAFRELFEALAEQLRNFIYFKTGNLEWAEDIMQEAFMELWKKRDTIVYEKAKSFLYSVANNRFLDLARHQKVVLKHREQLPPDHHSESPQHVLEQQEFKKKLDKAIADLPEKQRMVFLMNRIEKLTYREIAERMEVSVKAVEKLMAKALAKMRKLNEKI